jgi:lipid A ethanolaminephosphotransferase
MIVNNRSFLRINKTIFMLKIIQKQLDTNLIKISAVTAILYCLLFNTPVFLHNFKHLNTSFARGTIEFAQDFTLLYLFLLIMFFGLTIHRLVFIISTFILFVSGAIASYNLFFHFNMPSKAIVRHFFSIEPGEVTEVISIRLLIWIIFSILIAVYTIRHFKVETTSIFFSRLLSAICLLFTLNCIISPPYRILRSYFPILYLHNTYQYFSEKTAFKIGISTQLTFETFKLPQLT